MSKSKKRWGSVTEIDITKLTPYKIVGKECGRDKNGVFRCKCGKCRPLSENKSENRRNRGDNGGNG